MTDARVAHVDAEVLYAGSPSARVEAVDVEALVVGSPSARVESVTVEILYVYGTTPSTGTGTGSWSFAGAGFGERASAASGSGSWSFTGTGAGSAATNGTGSGSWAFAGAATGDAPEVAEATGAGTGSWSFVGAASGESDPVGSGTGVVDWFGTAVGGIARTGTGSGSWQFTGAASGSNDATGLVRLDVGVDLLILSSESQAPIVEADGFVPLDATIDLIVRHQLTPATPPAHAEPRPITRVAHIMPPLTAANPRAREGVNGYVVDRDEVGDFRVFVGGVDVTFLRDAPVRVADVSMGVQIGPMSATITVPQMRPWDVPGEGDLSMFDADNDAPVEILLVNGNVDTQWVFEGALARDEDTSSESSETYTFHAEGALMQAAHEPYDPPLFMTPKDPGWVIADVLNSVTHRRYGKIPRFTTGLDKITDRGQQGQSKWARAQDILSKCVDDDGRQLALVRVGPWEYRLQWKQTVVAADWTFTKGAPGVEASIRVDQSTRRDCIYGRGVDPEGGVWGNYFFTGIDLTQIPRYPMNNTSLNLDGRSDSTTDTGNGITLWQRRMRDLGFRVTVDGVMNGADVKWVRQIQRARGITVDGSLGPQTWAATFDPGFKEPDFTVERRPLAGVPQVEPWVYNANGTKAGKNPLDNARKIRHAMPEVDFGSMWKRDAIRLAARMLVRDAVPAHVGTITLTSDPHEAGSSRFDIRPGDNVQLLGHRGDVVVQVAEVSFDDTTVTLTVDSKGRDFLALDAILDRDRDARRDPTGRRGQPIDMSSLNKSEVVQFESESKAGFFPRTAINGDSGLWTVLPIFVSQVGVAKVEFQALAPKAEMVIVLSSKPITSNRLAGWNPDPLASSDGWYDQRDVIEAAGVFEIFGTPEEPGGYHKKSKRDGGPLTGIMRDRSGALYDSKYGGVVWVGVFTSRSTWVEGRVFPANGR